MKRRKVKGERPLLVGRGSRTADQRSQRCWLWSTYDLQVRTTRQARRSAMNADKVSRASRLPLICCHIMGHGSAVLLA
jgi:hypothetical protein